MEFVTINYSLNQTYSVHKNVFLEIVQTVIKEIKGVELLEEPIVKIVSNGQNVQFQLKIKIDYKFEIDTVLNELTKKLFEKTNDVINVQPNNIKVLVRGRK